MRAEARTGTIFHFAPLIGETLTVTVPPKHGVCEVHAYMTGSPPPDGEAQLDEQLRPNG